MSLGTRTEMLGLTRRLFVYGRLVVKALCELIWESQFGEVLGK
jgi:hypothetical protein